MDKNKIMNKLEPMIGNQFLISGNPERITGYKFEDSSVKLITDKRVRVFDEHQLADFLRKDCMEMEEDFEELDQHVADQRNSLQVSNSQNQVSYVPSFSNSHFAELRNVLMSNIERVQEDKEYLPQAVVVRDNVQSIIDLTKNEIDFMKTVNRIKR